MPSDDQRPVDRSFQLLTLTLDQTNVYHHHKETMANAGIVTQLALVASLFSVVTWPPEWVPAIRLTHVCVSQRGLSIAAFLAIWLLIHIFIRWQLRNRRWAAIFCAALERTLRKWAAANPPDSDLAPYDQQVVARDNRTLRFIDMHLFPCRSTLVYADVSRQGWPNGLVTEWIDQERESLNEPLSAETLLSLGSILALVIGLARVAN